MSNAARKTRKRLREPYIAPEAKVPTPLLQRSMSVNALVAQIRDRGLEKEFLALSDAINEVVTKGETR